MGVLDGKRSNKGRFCNTIASVTLVLDKVYAPAEVTMFLSADISRNRLRASLLWFTHQFKAISECRQKKFSQAEIQNKRSRKVALESSAANYRLVRAKGGF